MRTPMTTGRVRSRVWSAQRRVVSIGRGCCRGRALGARTSLASLARPPPNKKARTGYRPRLIDCLAKPGLVLPGGGLDRTTGRVRSRVWSAQRRVVSIGRGCCRGRALGARRRAPGSSRPHPKQKGADRLPSAPHRLPCQAGLRLSAARRASRSAHRPSGLPRAPWAVCSTGCHPNPSAASEFCRP